MDEIRVFARHNGIDSCGCKGLSKPDLNDLIEQVAKLPVDQRAELAQRLLGEQSGLSVVFGNNQLSGQILVQINTSDRESLGDILDAIANRIRTES